MDKLKNLKHFSKDYQPKHNGRPRGSKSYSTRIKELLKGISGNEGEWTSPLAAEKIKIIFAKNEKGKYLYNVETRQRAIDSILNRVEGMPVQRNKNENININPYDDLTDAELKQKQEKIIKLWTTKKTKKK